VEKTEMDGGRNQPSLSRCQLGIMHWLGATAVICTIFSGWQIYNASQLLPSTFRQWMKLGGWLGGGIA